MKKILIVIIALISLPNVVFSYGILRYQVLKPAEKPLPQDVKTIAFTYRNIAFPADSITRFYSVNNEIFLDTANYSKDIAEAAYLGFCSAIEEHYPADTIPMLRLPQSIGDSNRNIAPLSWEKVNTLCKMHNSDILVSLDDISIFNNYETWLDGDEYNGMADITSFHSWTIYDPLTEQLIFQETQVDSLQSHESSYSYEILIKHKLPHRDEIMRIVAFAIGENLAKRLAPQWKTIYREYFNRGNKEMRAAAAKVEEEKWEKALKIWEQIISQYNDKHRARAFFNSAIIYERLGNIEKALSHIKKSIATYKLLQQYEKELSTAENLKSVLEKRNIEVEKLKLQEGE